MDSRWEQYRFRIRELELVRARHVLDPFGRREGGSAADRRQAGRSPGFVLTGREAAGILLVLQQWHRTHFHCAHRTESGQVHLRKPELFLESPFTELFPAFSPDWRWVAYESNESDIPEIYVRPFPGPGGKRQISTGGGEYPLWSRDRHELLFKTSDNRMMAVSYMVDGDSFSPSKPRVWSETRLLNVGSPVYDLAPDGKRLAAILSEAPTHLTFLLNFFDELRRRAPAEGR